MKLSYQSSSVPVEYEDALSAMEQRVAAVAAGQATGMLWLLEHPPLYTAGTSAKQADLLVADRFPVFQTGRGGEYTYHGPGQRVGYVMMHLGQRGGCKGKDVRCFVRDLEQWLINSLQHFGLKGETREGRVGVWVNTPRGEAKIAALGVRVRHWVSFHGVALNVSPDLSHFQGIVPCGLRDYGVTSLAELGIHPSMDEVDRILKHHFADIFDAEWVEEALQS